MKGNGTARRASLTRLSGITESAPQSNKCKISEKFDFESASANKCIENLLKEKMGLVKILQDKNDVIELSGAENHRLRTCIQKLQVQNWNLAQSKSQMLAEQNAIMERVKSLDHDILSKEAVLRTQCSQDHEAANVPNTEFQDVYPTIIDSINEDIDECNGVDPKPLERCNHRASSEAVEKRRRSRRKLRKEKVDEEEAQVSSRPVRSMVKKVESYKESPLNTKLRRSE